MKLNIMDIVPGTSVDGPGLRTAIYMAGCGHACAGCHNRDSWDQHAGRLMSLREIMEIVGENGFPVTLTGGDPLYNPENAIALIRAIRTLDLGPIWLYTGYTWEEIISTPALLKAVRETDVVVDGPFMESLRDLSLNFCGSSNQRIILVKPSLDQASPVEWSAPVYDF